MHCLHKDHSKTAILSNTKEPKRIILKRNMGHRFLILFFLSLLIHYPDISFSAYLDLPKDSDGWTIFKPSADTNIVYVDSVSGNDTTCRTYLPSDSEIGSDPFNPTGSILPCSTGAKAKTFNIKWSPDWILFKRGAVFNEKLLPPQRGRSLTEPTLIASYGNIGALPIITGGLEMNGNVPTAYVAISGLDFYNDSRDPASPNYVGATNGSGLWFYSNSSNYIEAVLIEGCKIRFFKDNITIVPVNQNNSGFALRRNIISDAYSITSSHSQGVYGGGIDGFLIEENVFDHNGWLIKENGDEIDDLGEATIFNHNLYLSGMKNLSIRNNILIRGSSNNVKLVYYETGQGVGVTVDNNLFLGGEIAISIGPPDQHDDYSIVNPQITNNVWLNPGKWNPTNRGVAWFFYNHNWDGGNVSNNYMLHQTDDAITNAQFFHIAYTGRNINLKNNVVYDVKNIVPIVLQDTEAGDPDRSGISISNNVFNTANTYIVNAENIDDLEAYSFSINKYYSTKDVDTQFRVNSTTLTTALWQSMTGDDSTFEQVDPPALTRSIESYMAYIGETNTTDAFIEKCRAQGRYNWDSRFGAKEINAWITKAYSSMPFIPTPSPFNLHP